MPILVDFHVGEAVSADGDAVTAAAAGACAAGGQAVPAQGLARRATAAVLSPTLGIAAAFCAHLVLAQLLV